MGVKADTSISKPWQIKQHLSTWLNATRAKWENVLFLGIWWTNNLTQSSMIVLVQTFHTKALCAKRAGFLTPARTDFLAIWGKWKQVVTITLTYNTLFIIWQTTAYLQIDLYPFLREIPGSLTAKCSSTFAIWPLNCDCVLFAAEQVEYRGFLGLFLWETAVWCGWKQHDESGESEPKH